MQMTSPLCHDDPQSLTVNREGWRIMKQSSCFRGGLHSVLMFNSAYLLWMNEVVGCWEEKKEIMVHSLQRSPVLNPAGTAPGM